MVYIKGLKLSNLLKCKLYIKAGYKTIVSSGQKICKLKAKGLKRKKTKDIKKVFGSKKSRFIKEQEASRLLSNLELKTHLNKIFVLGNILL